MDIKDYWGVDSSPGSARDTTEKCGNLFATMGAAGSGDIPAYTADIGDRATVTPGTTPTLSTDGSTHDPITGLWTPSAGALSRAGGMGFNVLGTTYFNANSMMYALAEKATASSSVSISFWISPDGAAQGCILGSPFMSFNQPSNPNGANRDYDVFLNINPVCGAGIASSYGPDLANGGAPLVIAASVPATGASVTALTNLSAIGYFLMGAASWDYGGGDGTLSPAVGNYITTSYSAGTTGVYYHVMIAIHAVSGRPKVTIYIDDTAICTNQDMATDITSFDPGEPWKIPYGAVSWPGGSSPRLADGATQAVDNLVADPNVWQIGGRFIDMGEEWGKTGSTGLSLFPDGDGLFGAVTEVWIAEGQYLDWSSSTIRNKFHTQIGPSGPYIPVNLGAHGQTPTGTRPTMYFTGLPDNFVKNRVNGQTASVFGSLTLDGRYPGGA